MKDIGLTLAMSRASTILPPKIDIEPLGITENGSYTAEEGKAFNPVIVNVQGGAQLNISYGQEPPADTSKIWVKADEPESYEINCYSRDTGNLSVVSAETAMQLATGDQAAANIGDDIYLIGGASDNYGVLKYDTRNETIEDIGVLTNKYSIPSIASVGKDLYLFGSGYNKIVKFNTLTKEETEMSATLSVADARMCCVSLGKIIYIFGGIAQGSWSTRAYKYNTETDTISELTNLPSRTGDAFAVSVGTDIYIFGGRQYTSPSYKNSIIKFDTLNETFQTMTATLAVGISSMGCSVCGNNIYIFGGNTGVYQNEPSDLIQKYDTLNDTIMTLDVHLPVKMHSFATSTINNTAYLIGGRTGGTSTTFLASIYKCTMEMSLPQNKASIIAYNSITGQKGYLINEDTMKLGIFALDVFIGNENGIGEKKQTYYHNGTEWIEFT